ncbi:hypothetical protein BHM03_00020458 [Ensete ventricosum]|nr:hypothetical protein BHM03_00020458 [Ensete ventricosum]
MAYGVPLAFFFSSFSLLVASIIPGLVPVGVAEPSFYDPNGVTQLSWRPRIFLYRGFLSDEECDHTIKLARNKMARSIVADNESGKSLTSNVRTNSGMFLQKHQVKLGRACSCWLLGGSNCQNN